MIDRFAPEPAHGQPRTRNARWLSVLIPSNARFRVTNSKWAFLIKKQLLRRDHPNRSDAPNLQSFDHPPSRAGVNAASKAKGFRSHKKNLSNVFTGFYGCSRQRRQVRSRALPRHARMAWRHDHRRAR